MFEIFEGEMEGEIMITIEFAQIDAKDYTPCGFVKNYRPLKLGPINGELFVLMEQEYLTKLYILQQQIREKYSSLVVEDDPIIDENEVWSNGLSEDKYTAVKKKAVEMFGDQTADYYT